MNGAPTLAPTIFDHFRETGTSGQLSLVVFVIGLIFASLILLRRLGLRYRIALIVISLLPFFIGVFGFAVGTISAIGSICGACLRPDVYGILEWFSEVIQIICFTSVETIVLLVVSIILLVVGKERPT